jgi:cyclopropane fatty-acyl-phospholipid synthase-like methyltransferase
MKHNKIIKEVGNYYTEKVKTFGATPKGVDWNSEESQHLRFEQLSKVISGDDEFSILDYGCGYGSLYEYMKGKFESFRYAGFDISSEMLQKAKLKYGDNGAVFTDFIEQFEEYDYVVASGIFNVKLNNPDEDWKEYITETLQTMHLLSTKGFAFNILTKYSDKEFMKDNLYYADPSYWFDFCKKNFSKYVALLHDYPLYEFTILVKKY